VRDPERFAQEALGHNGKAVYRAQSQSGVARFWANMNEKLFNERQNAGKIKKVDAFYPSGFVN